MKFQAFEHRNLIHFVPFPSVGAMEPCLRQYCNLLKICLIDKIYTSSNINISYISPFFEGSILLTIQIIYIIINYILISYISYRGDIVGLHTLQFWTVMTVIVIITHSAMRLLYSSLFSRSFTLSSSSAASWQKFSQVKSAVRADFLKVGQRRHGGRRLPIETRVIIVGCARFVRRGYPYICSSWH